jgi:hypothetical protein
VGDGVSQLSDGFGKLAEDARETITDAAALVKKDIGDGLVQYNTEVQKVANRAPGGFGKKAAKYPWVIVTITLAFGLLLGGLLKPGRQPAG